MSFYDNFITPEDQEVLDSAFKYEVRKRKPLGKYDSEDFTDKQFALKRQQELGFNSIVYAHGYIASLGGIHAATVITE
jgi:hypothetical protein